MAWSRIAPRPTWRSMTIGGTLPRRKPGTLICWAIFLYAASRLGLSSSKGTSTVSLARVGLKVSTALFTGCLLSWSGRVVLGCDVPSGRQDSNLRSPAPKAGALATTLRPAKRASRAGAPAADPLGADDGNRTRVASLEDWGSTIELHPRARPALLAPESGCHRATGARRPQPRRTPAGAQRRWTSTSARSSSLGAEARRPAARRRPRTRRAAAARPRRASGRCRARCRARRLDHAVGVEQERVAAAQHAAHARELRALDQAQHRTLARKHHQRPEPAARCTAGGWPAVRTSKSPGQVKGDVDGGREALVPVLAQQVVVGGREELLGRQRAEQPAERAGEQQRPGARGLALAGDVDDHDLEPVVSRADGDEEVARERVPPAERSAGSASHRRAATGQRRGAGSGRAGRRASSRPGRRPRPDPSADRRCRGPGSTG